MSQSPIADYELSSANPQLINGQLKMYLTLKKLLNILNPQPLVGGLEISDSNIRFARVYGGKVSFFSAKLPPGIVVEGRVKDKEKMSGILASFKNQIAKKKKVCAVLNISDGNVYTEIFSIPKSADSDIEEVVRLNLQMISPIDFAGAYYDWQILGEKVENNNQQIEVFGAFAQRETIDEFEALAESAGFEIAAVEFSTLSLARSIARLEESFAGENDYLIFKVGSGGLSFGLLKNSSLYFLHFISWKSAYGDSKSVSLNSLKEVIIKEVQKVLSFYETRWNGKLGNLFVVTSTLSDEILKTVLEAYPNISPKIPSLKQFKNLSPGQYGVLGSALRGSMPREKDMIISLASVGTENKFRDYQITNFIRIWRNIISALLGSSIIVLALFDGFLMARGNVLDQNEQNIAVRPETGEISGLSREAENFNRKASAIVKAREVGSNWSLLLSNIKDVAGDDISVNRLSIQSVDVSGNVSIAFSGFASSEEKIISFKQKLESDSRFSDVKLQVSNITLAPGRGFNFFMAFAAKGIK